VLRALENLGDPRILAHDALRLRVQVGSIREQQLGVLDTVVRGVGKDSGAESHAGHTGLGEDLLLLRVREPRTDVAQSVALEDVGMHQSITPRVAVLGVLLVVIVFVNVVLVVIVVLILVVNVSADLLDEGRDGQPLIVVEGLEDVGNGHALVLVVDLVTVHGFCILRDVSGIVREREA
jgi:hypothetical protein